MIIRLIRPNTSKVNDMQLIVLKQQPEIIYHRVEQKIGSPVNYQELQKNGYPEESPTPYISKDVIRAHIKGGIKWKKVLDSQCYTPIKVLNTYTNDWKIKARVLKKNKRSWNNMRGSGLVMTVDLVDSEGTQIQGTFFNEAVLKFDNVIRENGVYTMANGSIKTANKKFTSISNNYCINFENCSKIEEVEDEQQIVSQAFDFKNIEEISNIKDSTRTVDFIGIVHSVTPIATVNLRNGVKKEKRTVSLADNTGKTISLSLWGEQANIPDFENDHPIIAVKGVRVSTYGGVTLNCLEESTIVVNPKLPQAIAIKKYYDSLDQNNVQLRAVSFDCTGGSLDCAQANERLLIEIGEFLHLQFQVNPDKGVYFTMSGYIGNIKADDKWIYSACPDNTCNKKVFYQPDIQKYRCEHWNQDYDEASAQYMLMVKLWDFTDSLYAFFYRDTATQIMDEPADQLKRYKLDGDNQAFTDAFLRQQYKKYKILMRARISTYAGGTKVTYSAAKVMDYDFKNENSLLLDRLEVYEQRRNEPEGYEIPTFDMHQEANFYGNGRINNFIGLTPTPFGFPAPR